MGFIRKVTATFLFCSLAILSYAGRIELQKLIPHSPGHPENRELSARRTHPAEHILTSVKRQDEDLHNRRDKANFNRLLVLLIDFQEDDNPLTTGNGKFVLEPDPDYPVSLGAPPRDYDYFIAHLEALRYYYLAASLGFYDLEFDLYPQPGGEYFAYTLPEEMAYYNPGMHDQELFVERVEEYFRDAFLAADESGEIDFSQYGHYMFIHAGSDWQHDIYGDTPHDIPSFFVRVGEGKEVYVNNGTYPVASAANVPETISQDGRYGLINAVMAHEFGHSLGFVDLYNVNNFYPGVGYWDLMDSGGTGRLVMQGYDGELYAIEGGLPTLPSAWHRKLVWGEQFREYGILRDLHEYSFTDLISVTAASLKPESNIFDPYIIRVPLSDTEYLLIENRDIDPDRDGGTAFKGAYPLTPGGFDYRVLLHPVGLGEDDFLPTYEYDLLLPGWMNRQGRVYGGGLVIWHIDDDVIYNQGFVNSQGEFVSNYDNNSVNTNYHRRGIRIIEADDIKDIGNPYSLFWNGTAYDPFYRYLPDLDSEGFFFNWSYQEHSYKLSANSKPKLTTNTGEPSLYSIYDISAIAPVMTFRYRLAKFDESEKLCEFDGLKDLGMPGKSDFLSATFNLPVFHKNGVDFYTRVFDENFDDWINYFGTQELQVYLTQKIVSADLTGDGYSEHLIVADNVLNIIKYSFNSSFTSIELNLTEDITEPPLVVYHEKDILLALAGEENLYLYWNPAINNGIFESEIEKSLSMPKALVSYDGVNLLASSEGGLNVLEVEALFNETGFYPKEFSIPDYSSNYHPVIYRDKQDPTYDFYFVQNSSGDVFRVNQESVTKIFSLSSYTNSKPTQLSLGKKANGLCYLVFAAGEYVFAIDFFGNLADFFPVFLERKSFQPYSHPRIIRFADDENTYIFEDEQNGYWSVSESGLLTPDFSYNWKKDSISDFFIWEELTQRLYFVMNSDGNILSNYISGYEENPVIWNGFRNGNYSVYTDTLSPQPVVSEEISVFVFPNPVRNNEFRIRVEGPQENFTISLFDITGRKIYKDTHAQSFPGYHEDVTVNSSKMSSGVYFGILRTGNTRKRFSFAVEK